MAFNGFTDETVPFFEGLAQNNTKEYFTANREIFEHSVKKPMLELLSDLTTEFGGEPKLFRQNRDIRFSPDKSPYKLNTYGGLHLIDKTSGFYVAVSADGIHAATGYHEMAPDQLSRYRQSLTSVDHATAIGDQLRKILDDLRSADIQVPIPEMKSLPRGVPKDSPNADLTKYKSLTASGFLEPEKIVAPTVAEWVANVWRTAKPLNQWLEKHVGASTAAPSER